MATWEIPTPPADLLRPALYLTALPIGNLGDITLRALETLRACDHVVAEDTRTTGRLLSAYGIKKPMLSFRVNRAREDARRALGLLEEGGCVAFCTDAGTPAISDPGSLLVRTVRDELPEVPVIPIPGPSALAAALSVAGFQTNPTIYLGFPSPKAGRRRSLLTRYADFEGCVVLFESVHRIAKCLADIQEIFPERDVMLGREMTKYHEEYRIVAPGTPEVEWDLTEKGEFTLVIGPPK